MTIPPLSLWQAFAIGLPLGIAGLVLQEVILRRRGRRRGTAGMASPEAPASTRAPVSTPAPESAPEPKATPAREAAPVDASQPPTPSLAPGRGVPVGSPWLPGLLDLESDLDQALEVIAVFVDAQPRLAGAQACAEALDRLVPSDRRGAAYAAFVGALETNTQPSELQQLADAVGVELTAQLLSVRGDINPGG
jgi:hypothetical protein